MRSVIVSVPDYETMQIIHAARRLYRQRGSNETAQQRQDMGRRFAEGYKRLLLQVKGEPPEEWLSLQKRILAYQKELNELGIRDYQVAGLDHEEVRIDVQPLDAQKQAVYHALCSMILFCRWKLEMRLMGTARERQSFIG